MQIRSFLIGAILLSLWASSGQATPVDNLAGATAAADSLLAVQFVDGSFPWIIGQAGKYQNVQGITAVGLVRAYDVTLNDTYLAAAGANRDWLVAYMDANPGAFISSSNAFFLADHARATLDATDYEQARRAMNLAIARYGNATNLVDGILNARVAQGHTNLGVWDVALFVRAAQEVGYITFADELMARLLDTDIVNPRNTTANWFELGLSGILFATAEAGPEDYPSHFLPARQILLNQQCDNGSFPGTWQGVQYCDDVQSTAYAVLGLTAIGDAVSAQSGCDYLVSTQTTDGGWDLGGYQIGEVNSEALMALAACVAPTNNAVTSHGDMVRGLI